MSSSFNIEEILTWLKNTYLSPDKKIREESELKLSQLYSQNIVSFSSQLIDLLKMPINKIDKSLRMSIILFLKRSVKEKIKNNQLDKDSNNQLIQLYITIIVNPNIDNKEIDNLKEIFQILLNNTNEEILIEIISYISKQITSMPLGSVNGVICILSTILDASPIKNKKIFIVIFEGILNMSSSIVENLYNKYININSEKDLDDYLKLNTVFSNIYFLFFNCSVKAIKKYKIKIDNFLTTLDNILIIGIKLIVDLKAKDNNRIISWTGNKKIDKNINTMKINIFKYVNFQVNLMGDTIMDKNKIENNNQFIKIIFANLEWLIMNKFNYLINIEYTEEFPDYHYSLIISFMFVYLKRILSKDNFIYEYTDNFKSMYKNILLPLLLITNIEEEIALDNEIVNGYIIDMEDIIYQNKQKKIKVTVAGLIKIFYKKNLKCNNYIFKYTLGLLDYLVNNRITNLDDKTLFHENDIIILLIKDYPKDKIIYILFLAFNIISDVEKCPNKVENDSLLGKFYRNSFDILTNNLNYPPLKHQFILFIRNYSLRFDEPDTTCFETNIKYLFNYLFETKYLMISNSAADAIQSFFKEDTQIEIKKMLLNVANNLTSYFEKQIIEVQISNFFEVLYQIISHFETRDNEFFKKIFINLCKRVNIEVERHLRLKFIVKKEKNKVKKKASEKTNLNNYKIIINKCFNIIKMLINSKRFVEKNYELIESSLKPLVAYMDEPEKIDFDDDIIYIIYMIIIHREKITGLCYSLIKNIYKYINKSKGVLLDVYQLINAYLAYGTEQILANKKWYEGIFEAFKSGMESKTFNKSGLYTSILVQTWVIHCIKLPNDKLNSLFNNVINKINIIIANNKSNKYLYDEDRYNFLGYVTLILSGLINYSNIIIPILQNWTNPDVLKTWLQIIIRENEIIFEYEIKIIIYSICMIIKNNIIKGDIQYLLDICVHLLKCQEKNGKYEIKKYTNKFLNFTFVEDDDDDDEKSEDDNEDENNEYKEIKEIVNKTINPVKDLDEFKNFNDLLNYLKSNKNDIYTIWENSLNDEQKNNISKLIGVKRISIQCNKNNTLVVPRRVVSIKRNINNGNNQ